MCTGCAGCVKRPVWGDHDGIRRTPEPLALWPTGLGSALKARSAPSPGALLAVFSEGIAGLWVAAGRSYEDLTRRVSRPAAYGYG